MIQMAVCDDEKKDRKRLRDQIQTYMRNIDVEYELAEYESGEQLLEQEKEIQLLFLDIVMNQKDGIQAGAEMKRKNPDIIIIYITNLDDQITAAINQIHSYGYLVKPVNRETLESILKDALEKLRDSRKEEEVLFKKENGTPVMLKVKNIYYLIQRNVENTGRKQFMRLS